MMPSSSLAKVTKVPSAYNAVTHSLFHHPLLKSLLQLLSWGDQGLLAGIPFFSTRAWNHDDVGLRSA